MNTTFKTNTLAFEDLDIGRWNAYASDIEYHCPTEEKTFTGSSNICPHCHTNLSDLSHWKWYNPSEPHPSHEIL